MEELIPIKDISDFQRLRALIVAAVLRCIYGAIEYAPSGQLSTRKNTIETIKKKETIKHLTRLCALTGWEACNVATKYLVVIMFALESNSEESSDDIRNIEVYDIVSKAVEDIYRVLSNKISRQGGIVMLEDREMLFQLAVCGSLICLQTPYITLSNLSLDTEKSIVHSARRTRTPQEKGIEFLLEQLIKPGLLESFIETLLRDMESSMKMSKEEANNYEEQMIRFKLRDAILMMLGEYISRCPPKKYLILEYFVKAQVFRGKKLRQSLIQDILRQVQNISFKTALRDYCIQKSIVKDSNKFRIYHLMNIDAFDVTYGQSQRMLLAITDSNILLLKPSLAKPCSICSEDRFCPEGPVLSDQIELRDIQAVLDFPKINKRCAIVFTRLEKKFSIFGSQAEKKEAVLVISFERDNNKYYFEQFLKSSNIKTIEDIIFPNALQQAYVKETKLQLDLTREALKCYISLEVWLKSGNRPTWEDYYGPKTLLLIYDKRLYLISERLDKWIYSNDINLDEDTLDIIQSDSPSNDPKVNAIRNYLKVEKSVELTKIKKVILDENGIPFIELEFASDKISILFGCDAARERCRIALIKALGNYNSYSENYY